MKSPNHADVRPANAPGNEKGRNPAEGAAQEKLQITENDCSATDPLLGWHGLAKPSRNRQQKRNWKRGSV